MATYTKIEFKKRDVRLQDIPKFYQELIENKVSIGIHKAQGSHNVEKAFWNEFGTTQVLTKDLRKRKADGTYAIIKAGTRIVTPARPFVRLYLYPEKMNKIFKTYNAEITNAFHEGLNNPRRSGEQVLKSVAFVGEAEMRKTIMTNDVLEPNAPLTIEIKGFDYPLFNTGRMMNAIKGKVSKI